MLISRTYLKSQEISRLEDTNDVCWAYSFILTPQLLLIVFVCISAIQGWIEMPANTFSLAGHSGFVISIKQFRKLLSSSMTAYMLLLRELKNFATLTVESDS